MLSQKSIKEFQAIWKAQYGEELSEKEALELATRLLLLFKVIYKPIPRKVNKHG